MTRFIKTWKCCEGKFWAAEEDRNNRRTVEAETVPEMTSATPAQFPVSATSVPIKAAIKPAPNEVLNIYFCYLEDFS